MATETAAPQDERRPQKPALDQHPTDQIVRDRLYIGGGNAKKLHFDLPDDCTVVDNTAGILGGIKLWKHDL